MFSCSSSLGRFVLLLLPVFCAFLKPKVMMIKITVICIYMCTNAQDRDIQRKEFAIKSTHEPKEKKKKKNQAKPKQPKTARKNKSACPSLRYYGAGEKEVGVVTQQKRVPRQPTDRRRGARGKRGKEECRMSTPPYITR
ncbi:hypothetical protein HDK64DRAFT_32954 [Phyllosticta capitalensis]